MGFALPAELQARICTFPPQSAATLLLYTFLLKKQEEIHREALVQRNADIRFLYFTYGENVVYCHLLCGWAAPDTTMIGELLL